MKQREKKGRAGWGKGGVSTKLHQCEVHALAWSYCTHYVVHHCDLHIWLHHYYIIGNSAASRQSGLRCLLIWCCLMGTADVWSSLQRPGGAPGGLASCHKERSKCCVSVAGVRNPHCMKYMLETASCMIGLGRAASGLTSYMCRAIPPSFLYLLLSAEACEHVRGGGGGSKWQDCKAIFLDFFYLLHDAIQLQWYHYANVCHVA